ncbi:MAG: hypothetical protein IJ661_08820 [Lachnospiraceae bacterium]|nr:hypothetical protein [Lachnospiraceae bacterium]
MNGLILTEPMIAFLRLVLIEVILILVLYSFNLISSIADKKILDKLSGDIKRKLREEPTNIIDESSAKFYLRLYRKRLINKSIKWSILWLFISCLLFVYETIFSPDIHNNTLIVFAIFYSPFFVFYLIKFILSFFDDKELYEVLAYCDHDNYYYDGKGNETARRITAFFYDHKRMVFRTKKVRISRSIPIDDNSFLYLIAKKNGKSLLIIDISDRKYIVNHKEYSNI